jgi:hypothetical protein
MEQLVRARERFLDISAILKDDSESLGQLHALLGACRRYVSCVVRMESELLLSKQTHLGDLRGWQAHVGSLDQARKVAHDSLISQLLSFNRTSADRYGWSPEGRIPVGGLFTLDPSCLGPSVDRSVIGDWALYLVLGLHRGPLGTHAWWPLIDRLADVDIESLRRWIRIACKVVCEDQGLENLIPIGVNAGTGPGLEMPKAMEDIRKFTVDVVTYFFENRGR